MNKYNALKSYRYDIFVLEYIQCLCIYIRRAMTEPDQSYHMPSFRTIKIVSLYEPHLHFLSIWFPVSRSYLTFTQRKIYLYLYKGNDSTRSKLLYAMLYRTIKIVSLHEQPTFTFLIDLIVKRFSFHDIPFVITVVFPKAATLLYSFGNIIYIYTYNIPKGIY